MNLLAHLYLSEEEPGSMIGNLFADSVKGRSALDSLSPEVRAGVLLHRRIDVYTDSHPVVRQSIARIRPRWGRFAPVLVDVFYDHVLANEWSAHSDTPLRPWLDDRFLRINNSRNLMPERALWLLDRIIADDRLMQYRTIDGVARSLERLSTRLSRPVPLQDAVLDLEENLEDLREDFRVFFPEVVRFARQRPLPGPGSS